MRYYHLTDPDKIGHIRAEGLIPMNGEHCRSVGDIRKMVFMTDYKSIPVWNALFGGKCAVVCIDIPDDDVDKFHMEPHKYGYVCGQEDTSYAEIATPHCIPSEYISGTVRVPDMTVSDICKLMRAFLYVVTRICIDCAYTCYRRTGDDGEFLPLTESDEKSKREWNELIADDIAGVMRYIDNTDFSMLNEDVVSYALSRYSEEGNITFADTVGDGEHRLFEILDSEKDELRDSRQHRKWLYSWLFEHFGNAMYTDTGAAGDIEPF